MAESRASLAVQWLRLGAYTAGVVGSIPGWGIKIPYAVRCSQNMGKNEGLGLLSSQSATSVHVLGSGN